MSLPEQVSWTRDVLERLYDIPYLRHALDLKPEGIPIRDARELQTRVIDQIQILKPPPEVGSGSLAWRLYNALDLRYVRGLTQIEAASELNISLRQLRREQDRGIEAIASLLANQSEQHIPVPNVSETHGTAQPTPIGEYEFLRLDDLLHGVLSLIDPLLTEKNAHVQVRLPSPAPVFWTNRTAVRQLLIMLFTWLVHDVSGGILFVNGTVHGELLKLVICSESLAFTPAGKAGFDIATTEHETIAILAHDARIEMHLPSDKNRNVELFVPMSSRQRILFVDDNLDNLALTDRFLANSPYDLIAVSRAEDTLVQAQTLQPSCIVLDVMMPGRDGWEILALLKSHPETIHIPVIVCSVLSNSDLARALGAAATLTRPHTANQLLETLHRVIAQSHQLPAARSV